jgi:hypothetical protein
MILFALILTGIQFATNQFSSLHYALNNPPVQLMPSVAIGNTNLDPNCQCPTGVCWGTNESCTPPALLSVITMGFNIDTSEPSQLEVWTTPVIQPFITNVVVTITNQYYGTNQVLTGTNQCCAWSLYGIFDSTNFPATNTWGNSFFMVRSTCQGYISDWNIK